VAIAHQECIKKEEPVQEVQSQGPNSIFQSRIQHHEIANEIKRRQTVPEQQRSQLYFEI
jgi:hypothetical protein